jgi:N-acetylmuramoyl-L-alanine amidase
MSTLFEQLVSTYKSMEIAFPDLKPITLAQWILESGRGESELAIKHFNFAGLKWRDEMVGFATPVKYEAHDGVDFYCKFPSLKDFIVGYWKFLTRKPYKGWEGKATEGPDAFIGFIGPIFNPAGDEYVKLVRALVKEASERLDAAPSIPKTDPLSRVPGTPVVIVIDPGHGGTSKVGGSSPNNAVSPSGELEKNWTLDIAKRTKTALLSKALATGKNVKVFLTRETDINLGLSARANVAKDKGAKLFLAIHFNGFDEKPGQKDVRGVETLIGTVNVNPAEDQKLAAAIQNSVLKAMQEVDPATKTLKNYDRTFGKGYKEQALGVLNDVALGNTTATHPCRACLVEIEFMDTKEVEDLFRIVPSNSTREANRQKIAEALADGLLSQV